MGLILLKFSGEYDVANKDLLHADLEALKDEPEIALDFTDVIYIDSTCIAELIRLKEHRDKRGFPRVPIVLSSSIVKRIFRVLRLETVFNMVDSLDEVLPRSGGPIAVLEAASGS